MCCPGCGTARCASGFLARLVQKGAESIGLCWINTYSSKPTRCCDDGFSIILEVCEFEATLETFHYKTRRSDGGGWGGLIGS